MQTILISLLFGLALIAGWYGMHYSFADMPKEDRVYQDKPPYLFKLVWPAIRLLTFHFGKFISPAIENKIALKLRRSGLDHALTPQQFFAGKMVVAAIVALSIYCLSWTLLLRSSGAVVVISAAIGFLYPDLWLKEVITRRTRKIVKALPFFLDVLTLSVEAGLSFSAALTQCVEKGPEGPLREEFKRVLREVRAGRSRVDALRDLAIRVDTAPISSLVSAIVQTEAVGVSLGSTLRVQSEQRRNERFLRAEKLAMEAPVKMLGPLVLFIFPCTFIVLLFPIVMQLLQSGILGSK